MTKEEAQEIVDLIDESTVIDDNWLDSLVMEIGYKKLIALSVVSGLTWNDFLEKHEGDYITDFQTKDDTEIYVGRVIHYFNLYRLIVLQDKSYVYYVSQSGGLTSFSIENIKEYLV